MKRMFSNTEFTEVIATRNYINPGMFAIRIHNIADTIGLTDTIIFHTELPENEKEAAEILSLSTRESVNDFENIAEYTKPAPYVEWDGTFENDDDDPIWNILG